MIHEKLEENLSAKQDPITSQKLVRQNGRKPTPSYPKPFSRNGYSHEDIQNLLAALDSFAIISKTDTRGVITYANKKFCDVSKFSQPDLIGKPHSIIRSEHHSREFFRHMWDTIKKGKSWTGEIKNKAKDGSDYWVYSLIFPVMHGKSKPDEYISIRFEITQLKSALERQSFLLERLNKSNQELADFANHVSHDLKAPLGSIRRAIGLIIDSPQTKMDASSRETLEMVVLRVKRLEHLINGLLDLGRVEVATDPFEVVDLNELVKEIVDLIGPSKNIKIDYSFPAIRLRGERVKFHQLFQNLIGNAVKFMDKRNGQITIGHTQTDREVRFFVKDTGPGIAKSQIPKVFKLFTTFVPPSADHHNTGIGLAIVKKIVEKYGGRICIESELKAGTSFFFTLPKAIISKN